LIDPDARERRVKRLLADWPSPLAGVLIGGYAVAAYGAPRYSVDVDIVGRTSAAKGWAKWLQTQGLTPEGAPRRFGRGEGTAEVQRWHLETITVDLMTGGVRDRRAETEIPEDWILREPRELRLELLSGQIDNAIPVVRPEGLWALKLLAGRPTDLTDLFGISRQPVRLPEIRELFEKLRRPSLERKLTFVSSQLHEGKLYKDSLSRLQLGSPDRESNRAAWQRFLRMIDRALPPTAPEDSR
jgi:hypothetical protein